MILGFGFFFFSSKEVLVLGWMLEVDSEMRFLKNQQGNSTGKGRTKECDVSSQVPKRVAGVQSCSRDSRSPPGERELEYF